jgi:ribosomal protein L17
MGNSARGLAWPQVAQRLAPQEVHRQPAVQRLVVELLQRERRTTKPKLRELARRVGVLAA